MTFFCVPDPLLKLVHCWKPEHCGLDDKCTWPENSPKLRKVLLRLQEDLEKTMLNMQKPNDQISSGSSFCLEHTESHHCTTYPASAGEDRFCHSPRNLLVFSVFKLEQNPPTWKQPVCCIRCDHLQFLNLAFLNMFSWSLFDLDNQFCFCLSRSSKQRWLTLLAACYKL